MLGARLLACIVTVVPFGVLLWCCGGSGDDATGAPASGASHDASASETSDPASHADAGPEPADGAMTNALDGGDGGGAYNVDFVTTCPTVAACAGDPSGTWDIVHGCMEKPGDGFCGGGGPTVPLGIVSGTLTCSGTICNLEVNTHTDVCSSSSSESTFGKLNGNTFDPTSTGAWPTQDVCVGGDTLSLSIPGQKYSLGSSYYTVLTLHRH
jgi:hypothetical protein